VLSGKGYDASPVSGEKSQFDVISDGVLLFSKQREGRFPAEDEILARLAG
jgi:predicted Rdx family selenoprotein